jgi:DNA-directed RNA polymerase specialized sigma24 family protein
MQPNNSADIEFAELIQRARNGDVEACQRLHARYAEHVLRFIRRRLKQPLRRIVDSTDVAQDVWKSVFLNTLQQKDFADPQQFLRLLAGIAEKKALERQRQQVETQKRSLARDVSLETHGHGLADRTESGVNPAARVESEDEWVHRLRNLSERERSLLKGLRAGESLEDFAQRHHLSLKTVYRVAKQIVRQGSGKQADG